MPGRQGSDPERADLFGELGVVLDFLLEPAQSSCQRASDQTSNRLGIPWMTTSFSSPA
jgi:hypothetical protein